MTVYLASPFFNNRERAVKAQVKTHLEQAGIAVIDPQGGGDPMSWEQNNNQWGRKIFKKDLIRIHEADKVIAIDWGLYGDCGTAWEVGYAYGINKHILVVVPDEKLYTPHSLMVANGCDNFVSVSRFLATEDVNTLFDNANKFYFLLGVEQK
jgi:nucleoside 2-deoxyribosyltransferase